MNILCLSNVILIVLSLLLIDVAVDVYQSLYSVDVRIISNKDCSALYGSHITESSICTSGEQGKGTCNGDSGGPLVVFRDNRNILVRPVMRYLKLTLLMLPYFITYIYITYIFLLIINLHCERGEKLASHIYKCLREVKWNQIDFTSYLVVFITFLTT